MFTGIVEHQGEIIENACIDGAKRLSVRTGFHQLHDGESIAVNGVCLTLLPDRMDLLTFDVSPETLHCTNLGSLKPGDRVNLERAMNASTRFGGHYVSGHVDGTRVIESMQSIEGYLEVCVGGMSASDGKYLIPKGSITVDGVSLTINAVQANAVKLLLVPHTLSETTLGARKPGDRVNIEFDYLAKLIAHQVDFAMKEAMHP